MDIQRWLHDTADRAPPDPSDDLPVPAFLRSPREAENHTRKYRRKRKRAASDSSIISQQQDFHQLGVSARPANRRRRDGRSRHSEGFARSIDSGSRYAEKRSPARSSDPGDPSRPADNPYERRARHKTKADRYQPKKEKGRQKKDDEPHAHKSKQERRKSHRSGDGGRTAGLIQSFQLKNGPKNNRLTLKPDNNAGLFKHGRASAQLAGRGKGLPDLVFNEMRFLVQPGEHQDEAHPDDAKRDTSAKERKRQLANGEISNYFDAHQLRHEEPVRRRKTSSKACLSERKTRRASTRDRSPRLEEAELPGVPYLGFGSRGAVHHSSQPVHRSTSYFTWSETPPAQVNRRRTEGGAIAINEADRTHSLRQKPTRDQDRRKSGQAPADRSPIAHGKSIRSPQQTPSKHARGSVEASIHDPLVERNATDEQEGNMRRSQSLPRHPPCRSQRRSDEVAGKLREPPSAAVSYRTSEILQVRDRMQALVDEPPTHSHTDNDRPGHFRSPSLRKSTSISGLLRNAQQALYDCQAADRDASVNHEHDVPSHDEQLARSRPRSASEKRSQHTRSHKHLSPALQRVSERFWHPALRPPAATTRSTRHPAATLWRQSSIPVVADEFEDDEMLDNETDTHQYLTGVPDQSFDDDLRDQQNVHRRTVISRTDLYRFAGGGPPDEQFVWPRSSTHTVPTGFGRASSVAQESGPSGVMVRGLDDHDDLEDFWKPNRLS